MKHYVACDIVDGPFSGEVIYKVHSGGRVSTGVAPVRFACKDEGLVRVIVIAGGNGYLWVELPDGNVLSILPEMLITKE